MNDHPTRRLVVSSLAVATLGAASLLLLSGSDASACPLLLRPVYFLMWEAIYPGSQSGQNVFLGTGAECLFCHQSALGGDGHNAYGWKIRELMYTGLSFDQAVLAAELLNSDGDPTGATNLDEIQANTQPGWTDGPNNTIFHLDGSTTPGQLPPAGILGSLDPGGSGSVGTPFCFGDGSGTACPCANESDPGTGQGCMNSSGFGGKLAGTGSTSIGADDLLMHGDNLLPGQPALLFAGQNAINGGNGVTFGDGLRCAGQNVVRLGVRVPNAFGDATWGPGISALGGWSAGDTRHVQGWYRDPNGGPCGAGFNLTNGVSLTFTP